MEQKERRETIIHFFTLNKTFAEFVFVHCSIEVIFIYLTKSLEKVQFGRSKSFVGLTALEFMGTDRVGLLSEVFAVLSDLRCNVVEAKVWTHKGQIAWLIYPKDNDLGTPIEDSQKLQVIEGMSRNVLKGDNDIRSAKISVSLAVTHTERRLHQMMFTDRTYEQGLVQDCLFVICYGASPYQMQGGQILRLNFKR